MNNSIGGVKNRRKLVIGRLETQLKFGYKPGKKEDFKINRALTDSDINRINKEIEILKTRI